MKASPDSLESTVDEICCDVCGCSTRVPDGSHQFGLLQADWSQGSQHAGEQYRLRLCEGCFFQTLANLRREYQIQHLFDDEDVTDLSIFGRVDAQVESGSVGAEVPAAAKRLGMLQGELGPIPDDFDVLGADEIQQCFENGEDEQKG